MPYILNQRCHWNSVLVACWESTVRIQATCFICRVVKNVWASTQSYDVQPTSMSSNSSLLCNKTVSVWDAATFTLQVGLEWTFRPVGDKDSTHWVCRGSWVNRICCHCDQVPLSVWTVSGGIQMTLRSLLIYLLTLEQPWHSFWQVCWIKNDSAAGIWLLIKMPVSLKILFR